MNNNETNPHILITQKYHLSREKSREAVIDILKRCDVPCPKNGWDNSVINWKDVEGETSFIFCQLVEEARKNGVIARIQKCLDKSDSVFGGTFGEFSMPNFQIIHNISYAGWEKKAQGPCRSSSTEIDLMEDILDYRIRVCEHSNEYNFRLCARFYRAYLSSCISIVESFINRHVLRAEHDGFSSPEFDRLKSTTNLEERVRLWFQVCSEEDPKQFFESTEWCHFQEIRKQRNGILHAIDPIFVYSLKEMWQYLNKVQTGVGELLLLMRRAHKKQTLLFIERLRTAPKVDFHQIRFKSDGNHVIKVLHG